MHTTINRKAARYLDSELDSFSPTARIQHRARVTDINEWRNRDRKRRIPRDLDWQLVGGEAA